MRLGSAFAVLLAVAASNPADAGEADAATLAEYCRTTMNAPAGVCDCLLRQFAKLGEDQQALLAAIVANDEAAMTALRAAMSPADTAEVDGFLARKSLLCRPSG